MNMKDTIALAILKRKRASEGADLVDAALAQDERTVRQLCAKVHVSLYEEVDRVTDFLGLSKREFVETAVADAVRQAHDAIAAFVDERNPQEAA